MYVVACCILDNIVSARRDSIDDAVPLSSKHLVEWIHSCSTRTFLCGVCLFSSICAEAIAAITSILFVALNEAKPFVDLNCVGEASLWMESPIGSSVIEGLPPGPPNKTTHQLMVNLCSLKKYSIYLYNTIYLSLTFKRILHPLILYMCNSMMNSYREYIVSNMNKSLPHILSSNFVAELWNLPTLLSMMANISLDMLPGSTETNLRTNHSQIPCTISSGKIT